MPEMILTSGEYISRFEFLNRDGTYKLIAAVFEDVNSY